MTRRFVPASCQHAVSGPPGQLVGNGTARSANGRDAGWCVRSAPGPARAVRGPLLAAHAVVAEEEAFGIVSPLDLRQPLVVLAPERPPPVALEIVRLVDVAARVRRGVADDLHRGTDPCLGGFAFRRVGLVAPYPWVSVRRRGDDDQSRSLEDRRVHRGLPTALDRVRRSAGLALVEVQRDGPGSRRLEEQGSEPPRIRRLEQVEGDPARLIRMPVCRYLPALAGPPPEAVRRLVRARV